MILIGVVGHSGVGRTTFAAALAAMLATKQNHVLLGSLDDRNPALAVWEPTFHDYHSVREIINLNGSIDVPRLSKVLNPSSLTEKLCLLGFSQKDLAGESSMNERLARELVKASRAEDMADFFVVDGTNYGDALTTVAIDYADVLIQILPADNTGLLLELCAPLRPARTKKQHRLTILFQRNSFDPVDTVAKMAELNVFTVLPFTDEAHRKLVDGRLFSRYSDPQYRGAVDKTAEEIRRLT